MSSPATFASPLKQTACIDTNHEYFGGILWRQLLHKYWRQHPKHHLLFQNDHIPEQTGSARGKFFASYRSRMCRTSVSETHRSNYANPKRSTFPMPKHSLVCGVFSIRDLLLYKRSKPYIMWFCRDFVSERKLFAPDLPHETS